MHLNFLGNKHFRKIIDILEYVDFIGICNFERFLLFPASQLVGWLYLSDYRRYLHICYVPSTSYYPNIQVPVLLKKSPKSLHLLWILVTSPLLPETKIINVVIPEVGKKYVSYHM